MVILEVKEEMEVQQVTEAKVVVLPAPTAARQALQMEMAVQAVQEATAKAAMVVRVMMPMMKNTREVQAVTVVQQGTAVLEVITLELPALTAALVAITLELPGLAVTL
jgi:hypothetical protein